MKAKQDRIKNRLEQKKCSPTGCEGKMWTKTIQKHTSKNQSPLAGKPKHLASQPKESPPSYVISMFCDLASSYALQEPQDPQKQAVRIYVGCGTLLNARAWLDFFLLFWQ